MTTLRLLFSAWVIASASVTEVHPAEAPRPSPSPATQPSPQPTRTIATTIQIESSRGSYFGNARDTLTIVHNESGWTMQESDRRIAMLVDALGQPCKADVKARDLSLRPGLIRGLSDEQLGENITRGQRRWFDRTFTNVALEDAVTYYYGHYLALDGGFARLRITLSDTNGTLVEAESTAQQALMLPWHLTTKDRSTCVSWNPQISHAVAAYLGGNAADRLNGSELAVEIAHAFIRQHLREWTLIPVRERFSAEFQRLSGRYVIDAAELDRYDSGGLPPEKLVISMQPLGGPKSLELSVTLTPRGSQLPGLDAALEEAPSTVAHLNAFAPIYSKLGTPGYNVWASVSGSSIDDADVALRTVRECGADGLAALMSRRGVVFATVGEPSPPGVFRRQSSWAILPDGSAVLWRLDQSTAGPVLGLSVPAPDTRNRDVALFARDGTVVSSKPCLSPAPAASTSSPKRATLINANANFLRTASH